VVDYIAADVGAGCDANTSCNAVVTVVDAVVVVAGCS
jgi:hypothetical protein